MSWREDGAACSNSSRLEHLFGQPLVGGGDGRNNGGVEYDARDAERGTRRAEQAALR